MTGRTDHQPPATAGTRPLDTSRHRKIYFPQLLAVASALLILSGCAGLGIFGGDKDDREGPPAVVSLHQIHRAEVPSSRLSAHIFNEQTGERLRVHKMPLLSSRYFADVAFAPDERSGVSVMKAILDNRGQLRWMQARLQIAGDYVAVTVDGSYRFMWRIPTRDNSTDEMLRIAGPWEPLEAERITRRARLNYEELNKR